MKKTDEGRPLKVYFLIAAVTNYHKFGILKQQNFILL